MKKKQIFLAVLACLLVYVLLASCKNETSNNTDPKILVVQSIPTNVYAYGNSGGLIGVFPTGTTTQQALFYTGLVAGASLSNYDITVTGSGPYTLTIPLYNATSTSSRWTGNGTYDVFVILNGGGGHYYKVGSVNFSSGTTTVAFSRATEVYP